MLLLSCSIGKVRSLPVKSCSAGISRWKPSRSSVTKTWPSMPTLSRSRRQVASSRPPSSRARVRRATGSKARQTQALFFSGSIRVGCWDWACGGQEPSSRGTWLGRPLQGPSPAEIVRQVARRDAVEAAHPALQPAVVGVHVLDVEGAVAHPDPGGDIDRLVADATLSGEGGVGLAP